MNGETDYEYESMSGMGDIALLLGWTAPPDDDGFWFLEEHGPVHDTDLRPFLIEQIARLKEVEKACDYYRSSFLSHARPPIGQRPQFVPSRVRLQSEVSGDFPFTDTFQFSGDHPCECNQYGAVSVLATNGKKLGLRPGEFEPLEWIENPKWEAANA